MRVGQTSVVAFGSQLVSSFVGFLATIYITRTLGSAVFGEYMIVIGIVIWLQVIGILGVEDAVTKRVSEVGDSDRYFTAGVAVLCAAFLVLSALVVLASGPINAYVGAPVAVYIPALLVAGMAFKVVAAALRGEHKVHVAALLNPVDRTLRSTLQILALVFGFGLVGLLGGYVVAGLIAALVGIGYLSVRFEPPRRQHVRSITSYARFAWVGKLGSRTFASMDTIILAVFVTSSFVGYYEVAWSLASLLAFFGVAISQTMFPEMSAVASEENRDAIAGLVRDAVAYAGFLLIPGLVGALIVGDLVLRLYGNEFARAATVLVLLVVARFVYEYGNQFLNGLNAIDRPDLAFRVNAVFIVMNVVLNVVLISAIGWTGAAIATAVSAGVTAILAYRAFTAIVPVRLPYRTFTEQWLAAAGMGVVVYGFHHLLPDRVLAGVVLVAIGGVTYVALIGLISREFRTLVRRNAPVLGE